MTNGEQLPELQQTLDNLGRLDERTIILAAAMDKATDRLERLSESLDKIDARLIVIESRNGHKQEALSLKQDALTDRVSELEFSTKHNAKQFAFWADVVFKVIATVAAAFVVFKLGLGPHG